MSDLPRPEELITSKPRAFWKAVKKYETAGRERYYAVKKALGRGNCVLADDAREALAGLFLYSHHRILEKFPQVAENYPTAQYTNPKRRNLKDKPLFWIDHFTGGVRLASTLNWFSSMRLKDGLRPGASTHFVIGYHDDPYYIIPIEFCAWHARRRNRDSIGVEMVNAGPVHTENGAWHFYAGPIPKEILEELTPRRVIPPYKGADNFLPYTTDQIVNNLLLKRLVVAAVGDRLSPDRFTGHSDWQEGKKDPGPLWPQDDINSAVYELIPVQDYRFITRYEDAPSTRRASDDGAPTAADYPEIPQEDRSKDGDELLSMLEVQKLLRDHGHPLVLDGIYGPKTKKAVRMFQRHWNNTHTNDQIKVDGIPGPVTCARLTQGVTT